MRERVVRQEARAADDLDDSLRGLGRVLVTGAAGRIGSATTRRLTGAGVAVTAVDLRPPTGPASTGPASTGPASTHIAADRVVVGDVTDRGVVAEALDGVRAVVHLGAIATPIGQQPYAVFRGNTDATFNVLDQAGTRGVARAVIASSINAAGQPFNPHPVRPAYYPIDEDLPIDLADAYSLSKQVDEHTARTISRRDGITVVALRFPLVGTPDLLERAARAAIQDPDHAAREGWSYLDLRDAVEAICLALVRPLHGMIVLCVGAPDNLTGQDTAALLRAHAPGVPVRGQVSGTMSLYSSARARDVLGWTARHLRSGDPRSGVTP